jgi:hypothetical protein
VQGGQHRARRAPQIFPCRMVQVAQHNFEQAIGGSGVVLCLPLQQQEARVTHQERSRSPKLRFADSAVASDQRRNRPVEPDPCWINVSKLRKAPKRPDDSACPHIQH